MEFARETAFDPIQCKEIILLPSYFGNGPVVIRIREIPPEVTTELILASIP